MDRFIKASAIGIVLCGIVFGIVAGSRIDQSTITLLSGTLVGLAVGAPCAAIITWLAIRRREDEWKARERAIRQQMQMQPPPPAWDVRLPAPPMENALLGQLAALAQLQQFQGQGTGAGAGYGAGGYPQVFLPRPPRKFYEIGDDGEAHEMADDSSGPLF